MYYFYIPAWTAYGNRPENSSLASKWYMVLCKLEWRDGELYRVYCFKTYEHLLCYLKGDPWTLATVKNHDNDIVLSLDDRGHFIYRARTNLLLNEDGLKLDLQELKNDVEEFPTWYGDLMIENKEFCLEKGLEFFKNSGARHGLSSIERGRFLRYRQSEYQKKQRYGFRQDPVPGTGGRYRGRYCRHMSSHGALKGAIEAEFLDLVEIEEETGLRITLKLRPDRNSSNTPNPWDIEPVRSRWHSKSWKDHSKGKHQHSKHKPNYKTQDKWEMMSEWLEDSEDD